MLVKDRLIQCAIKLSCYLILVMERERGSPIVASDRFEGVFTKVMQTLLQKCLHKHNVQKGCNLNIKKHKNTGLSQKTQQSYKFKATSCNNFHFYSKESCFSIHLISICWKSECLILMLNLITKHADPEAGLITCSYMMQINKSNIFQSGVGRSPSIIWSYIQQHVIGC